MAKDKELKGLFLDTLKDIYLGQQGLEFSRGGRRASALARYPRLDR
jgi:hypothetical protein